MEGTWQLVWGMIFGSIGFGFFLYGRKQHAPVPLVTGIVLIIFPYFIANIYALVVVGCALIALPYFLRL